jgi:hypothetical protein
MSTIRSKVTAAFDKLAAKQPDVIQTGAIRRTVRSGGGPSDPDGGAVTTTDFPARMAVFEIGVDRIDGSNILAGDLRVIVEPISIEVTAEDQVICDRGALTIAKLGREASGGETALYDMLCRGGR